MQEGIQRAQETALHQMPFKEVQAFFYQIQVNKMKAQGKGIVEVGTRKVMQEVQEVALHKMSFKEVQAFFYNKQVKEMKSQGKRVWPVMEWVSTGCIHKFSALSIDNMSPEETTLVGVTTDVRLPVLGSPCSGNGDMPVWSTGEAPRIRTTDPKVELELDVMLEGREKTWDAKALVDSRANDMFLDKRWADENGIPLIKLGQPISVLNVDGTPNVTGNIMHVASLIMNYQGH
ncbi:hypothetical protein BKA82DRAFT_4360283 [Pisolithus tinctorius]|nr:hypothetical protein BKA82DRAFT_4360283 [Pisolithus tinctorius]